MAFADEKLEAWLLTLVDLMGHRGIRLVVGQTATLEGPGGIEGLEVPVDLEVLRQLLENIDAIPLPLGFTATAVCDHLVLWRAPAATRRLGDLSSDGWISQLAARLIDGALGIGKNIVVAGPWAASTELMAAAAGSAKRPAVFGTANQPVPQGWMVVDDLESVRQLGVDRLVCWQQSAPDLAQTMLQQSGVVGWIDAFDLPRALMRYEAAADGNGTAAVLAGVDLLVIVQGGAKPRVSEVYEITLAADGYRPRLIFTIGVSAAPTALVPVAQPTFVEKLAAIGDAVLAEELRHAAPPAPAAAPPVPAAAPPVPAAAPPVPAAAPPVPAVAATLPAPVVSGPTTSAPLVAPPAVHSGDGPPPGWELDVLGEEVVQEASVEQNRDAASMAASFGLAPPPAPVGQTDVVGNSTFADALVRAKERDAELQRELHEEDGA